MEVLRRHLNRENAVKSVKTVLQRIEENDQADVPGVHNTESKSVTRSKGLTEAQTEQLVECFRQGTQIKKLVEQYGVSESYVKRALRKNGVGRRERY